MGGRAVRMEGGGVSFAERHAGCRALSETLEQHITKDQVSKSGTQHPFRKSQQQTNKFESQDSSKKENFSIPNPWTQKTYHKSPCPHPR